MPVWGDDAKPGRTLNGSASHGFNASCSQRPTKASPRHRKDFSCCKILQFRGLKVGLCYTGIVDCCDVAQRDAPEAVTGSAVADMHDATAMPRGAGWRSGSTLGAIAVALLPKCPACWSAYAGLSSLLGLSFVVEQRYLLPLTCALLALSLAALGLQARRQRRYGPWLLACAAAIATLTGKFALVHDGLMYAGIGSLLLASLWSSCRWSGLLRRAPVSAPAS